MTTRLTSDEEKRIRNIARKIAGIGGLSWANSTVQALLGEIDLLREELAALKYVYVIVVGGTDYEGLPTCELNYLQRLRILLEKEATLVILERQIEIDRNGYRRKIELLVQALSALLEDHRRAWQPSIVTSATAVCQGWQDMPVVRSALEALACVRIYTDGQ